MGRDVKGLSPSSVKVKLNGTSNEEASVEAAAESVMIDLKSSEVEESKSSSPAKSGLEMPPVENVDTKHIVQNSFTVIDQPVETPAKPPSITSSSKKSQSNSSSVSRKHLDDEDNWSTSSSTTASAKAARTRTTMPVAPKFTVNERLEKRKEFYSKLEEKHKALEAEKHEYEARNKEEQQAAIKQLRKAMVYKANPVPSFYYEGPPPKKEIKKAPTTRAVSPKFGRRKSCGDAAGSSSAEKAGSVRTSRYSMGAGRDQTSKQGSASPTINPKKKGLVSDPSSKGSIRKERPKQLPKEPSPAKEPEQKLAQVTEPDPPKLVVQETEPEPPKLVQDTEPELVQETDEAQAAIEDETTEQKIANLSVQT